MDQPQDMNDVVSWWFLLSVYKTYQMSYLARKFETSDGAGPQKSDDDSRSMHHLCTPRHNLATIHLPLDHHYPPQDFGSRSHWGSLTFSSSADAIWGPGSRSGHLSDPSIGDARVKMDPDKLF